MEEKKLTDEEVIKGLECCIKGCCDKSCFGSEMGGIADCINILTKNALDLIHRLQDENERLTEGNSIIKSNPPVIVVRSLGKTIRAKLLDYDRTKEQNAELQKQVDELKQKNEKLRYLVNECISWRLPKA